MLKIVGSSQTTVYNWWQQKHIQPPLKPGGRGKQASFTLEEVFRIGAFARALNNGKRRFRDASPLARYIQYRPGILNTVINNLDRPIKVKIYGLFDLVGFEIDKQIIVSRAKEGFALATAKNVSPPTLLEQLWARIFQIERDRKLPHDNAWIQECGNRVTIILQDYKFLHENRDPYLTEGGVLRLPKETHLYERLLVESWAINNIGVALLINPFVNHHDQESLESFSVDLTDLIEKIEVLNY